MGRRRFSAAIVQEPVHPGLQAATFLGGLGALVHERLRGMLPLLPKGLLLLNLLLQLGILVGPHGVRQLPEVLPEILDALPAVQLVLLQLLLLEPLRGILGGLLEGLLGLPHRTPGTPGSGA